MTSEQWFDIFSAAVIVAGLAITLVLLVQYIAKYRHEHDRWAFRAVAMLATVAIVWMGSGATLAGKVQLMPLDLSQYVALGARITLLVLATWLLLLPHITDDHGAAG